MQLRNEVKDDSDVVGGVDDCGVFEGSVVKVRVDDGVNKGGVNDGVNNAITQTKNNKNDYTSL